MLKGKTLFYFKSEEDMGFVSMIDLRVATGIEENGKSEKVFQPMTFLFLSKSLTLFF